MEKGEKGEKGSDEERVETRPRRPRRPRQGGADEDEEYNKPAESKISEPAYTEPQAKPRRRRQVEESNDTAGDGGWMGGMAPDNKQKFEPEQETPDVMTTYVNCVSLSLLFTFHSGKIKTNISMMTMQV